MSNCLICSSFNVWILTIFKIFVLVSVAISFNSLLQTSARLFKMDPFVALLPFVTEAFRFRFSVVLTFFVAITLLLESFRFLECSRI